MIIVEGMDNSGKTKLAEHLANEFDLPMMHSPRDRSNIIQATLNTLVLNPNAVLDRFALISEAIYGPVIRKEIAFGGEWLFYMNKLARCKPLIFYCRPPEEKVLDLNEERHMYGVIANSVSLLGGYDALMTSWGTRLLIMKYDFTIPSCRSFADFAVQTYLLKRRIDEH